MQVIGVIIVDTDIILDSENALYSQSWWLILVILQVGG